MPHQSIKHNHWALSYGHNHSLNFFVGPLASCLNANLSVSNSFRDLQYESFKYVQLRINDLLANTLAHTHHRLHLFRR